MKLGVDFGTTRIVAAAVDRGNYPVVQFEDSDGTAREWFPPLLASRNGERRYGWDAWAVQGEPDWTLVRSMKRLLEDAGPCTNVRIEQDAVPILQLLVELTSAFKRALLEQARLPGRIANRSKSSWAFRRTQTAISASLRLSRFNAQVFMYSGC